MNQPLPHRLIAMAVTVIVGLTACGSDDASGPELSPAAAEGRSVMRSKGCASCHGSNGGGGVGPAFVGLFGSERRVEIPADGDDGGPEQRVVTADRDYLVESIVDPSAKRVEGYSLPMPRTELTDAEIDAIISYIEAIAAPAPGDDG